jgi:cell filamentation protein
MSTSARAVICLRITLISSSSAGAIFERLREEHHLARLDPMAFSQRAAHYLSELNALHPFREGNGRTQREFVSHLAYSVGYYIAW